jgi:hypothetical protein
VSQTTCLQCNNVRERPEDFTSLDVRVKGEVDVVSSLIAGSQPEVLAADNAVMCPTCDKKVRAGCRGVAWCVLYCGPCRRPPCVADGHASGCEDPQDAADSSAESAVRDSLSVSLPVPLWGVCIEGGRG